MRNFFGINVKTQEKTYAPYIVRSVSAETSLKQESSETELLNAQKASKLPLWLRIIQMLCLMTAVCIACGILEAFGDGIGEETFAEMWERFVGNGAITLIIVGAVCLAVFLILLIWGAVRAKSVFSSPALQAVTETHEKIQSRSYEELGVPEDADEIDIFSFPFKYNRKGNEVGGNPVARYINVSVKIFKKDDGLYFADTSDIVKIPLSSVTTTNVITKRVNFYGWTKQTPHNSKEYKPFKITANNMGALFIKGCYSVGVIAGGEEMEIIIPPYEKEIIEKYIRIY